MSYRNQIEQFLRSKGLNDYAVAGILGNFMVESGFNPGSFNPGEKAIGFANWEGGRRTALQQWALSHYGAQETDAQAQLTFMWHELTTSYSGVLDQLRHATSAGQAAAIFDAHYEVSSGDARQKRIDYANQFYSGKGPNPTYTGPLATGGSSGASSGGGGGMKTTRAELSGVDSLGDLLDKIPELSKLVDRAIANNWSVDKFQNAIEDSDWWKNHSSTARQVLVEKANDPASWGQDLRNTKNSISTLAHQLGFTLTADQLENIATSALMTGNGGNQQWLTQQVGRRQDYTHLNGLGGLQGGMAATAQQLQQLAGDYGFKWDASETAQRAQDILMGKQTLDTYKQRLQQWAISAFPSLAKEIRGGATVKELADPYVQSMSQLLEINPGSISLFTPKIRQAMQGTAGKDGQIAQTPLWSFEDQLRQDPRWAMTDNAHQQISSIALQIGQAFGFDG